MRNATCVGTETSKVPTRVTLLFIFYSVHELSGTNWESGWYKGEVQSYDEDEDIICVMFEKEKTELYSIHLMSGQLEGIIRPVL